MAHIVIRRAGNGGVPAAHEMRATHQARPQAARHYLRVTRARSQVADAAPAAGARAKKACTTSSRRVRVIGGNAASSLRP
jgi:hypothetical protein